MGKTVVRITLLLLALVAIGVVTGATSPQRQVGESVAQLPPQAPTTSAQTTPVLPPGHRHVVAGPYVPITSRLEPDDKVVEFISESTPLPYNSQNVDAENELEAMLKIAPAVAVIDVIQKESAFNAGEDWIMSTLTVQVREVLKDSTGQLVAGNLVNVTESGGEITLPDGRRIIARSKYNKLSRVGGTYLAVLGFWEGKFGFDGLFSAQFDNGKVKRMRLGTTPSATEDIEQKTPEWATQRARAITERRKQ